MFLNSNSWTFRKRKVSIVIRKFNVSVYHIGCVTLIISFTFKLRKSTFAAEDFFKSDIQIIKCKSEPEIFNLFLYNDYKILRDAVKHCEDQLTKEENIDSLSSGSTLCMVIQIYKKIICMNIGDSRAIISMSEILRDDIKNLSIDHKPNLKKVLTSEK